MNHAQMSRLAADNGLGEVRFQFNTARNTGQDFEVGYVVVRGHRELFCKKQPGTDSFHLCNQFRDLA
jgi:hypothetical protein